MFSASRQTKFTAKYKKLRIKSMIILMFIPQLSHNWKRLAFVYIMHFNGQKLMITIMDRDRAVLFLS